MRGTRRTAALLDAWARWIWQTRDGIGWRGCSWPRVTPRSADLCKGAIPLGPYPDRRIAALTRALTALQDKDALTCAIVQAHHLLPRMTARNRARSAGIAVRTYYQRYQKGLAWLDGELLRGWDSWES